PDVDVVGKTVVTDIPDGLGSGLPGGMQLWQEAGPVIAARPALDAMPSQAVPDGRDPVPLQGLVVRRRKDVVAGAAHEVQAASVHAPVRGTLEPAEEVALEQRCHVM